MKRSESLSKTKNVVALNPLSVFPSKNDYLVKAIFSDRKKRISDVYNYSEDSSQHSNTNQTGTWLSQNSIDQNFGINGNSQVDFVRRNFRRLNSCDIFTPLGTNSPESSLSEISASKSLKKRYVLVEESTLKELSKFESLLEKERTLLGEQCTMALSESHFEARIPLPAIRFAVHNVCEERMKRVRKEIDVLNSDWSTFSRQNHYNKPHLYLKNSYLNSAPIIHRAMKLRLVREAAREWAKRRDRDTMLFEDDMSYLTGLYFDALTRRRDYDRYFILAARYGPLSDHEFNVDARPGRRYLMRATEGAVKLQRLWVRFWAITKLRRYRAAKCIQKYVRRFIVYKKLHPIIRVRLKFGKRTYYAFFWQKWKEYNSICRNIRMALHFRRYEMPLRCLQAWRRFLVEEKAHREQVLNKLAMKYGSQSAVHYTFTQWVAFRNRNRYFKRRLRRLIQNPLFGAWVEFTQFSKHVKKLAAAATKMQSVARGRATRHRYKRQRRAQETLRNFARLIAAKKLSNERREKVIGELFASWGPEETARRTARLNEAERQRQLRRTAFVQQKEKAAVAELKKHFKTPDGQLQVRDRVAELLQGESRAELLPMHNDQRLQFAMQELIARCATVTRQLHSHDYTAKNPSFILCPFPACACSLTTEAQYRSHVASLPLHVDLKHSFASCHLLLRHPKGFALTRSYLLRTHGLAGAINSLDFWAAMQEWRKTPTARKEFFKRALAAYEMFLAEDAPRKIDFDVEMNNSIASIRSRMQLLKHHDGEGYFQVAQAKRGLLRQLLGLSAQNYDKWSDLHVLNPTMFNEVEWGGFQNVFTALERDAQFKESVEYLEYQKLYSSELLQRDSALLEDCKSHRNNLIYEWTVEFLSHETALRNKAEEAALRCLQREADRLFHSWSEVEVHRRMLQVSYEEQVRYEMSALVCDDAVAWAEENVLDFVFDFYVRSLLEKMWAVPECQKGMLEYSGLLKSKLKKKLTAMVDMNSRKTQKASEDWFDDFVKQTTDADMSTIKRTSNTDSQNSKATCIQRRIRGVLSRNRVRKLFVKTFAKRLDAQSKAYYYVNVRTNESSWTRPRFTERLFHGSKW